MYHIILFGTVNKGHPVEMEHHSAYVVSQMGEAMCNIDAVELLLLSSNRQRFVVVVADMMKMNDDLFQYQVPVHLYCYKGQCPGYIPIY